MVLCVAQPDVDVYEQYNSHHYYRDRANEMLAYIACNIKSYISGTCSDETRTFSLFTCGDRRIMKMACFEASEIN